MLRICFLGSIKVFNDGYLLPPFSTQKAASLFEYLVMHSEKAHSRQFLADLLWPDRPEENARRSLHTALWQIRNTLKAGEVSVEQYLVTTNSTVTWVKNSGDWLDVEVFENLYNSPNIQEREYAVQLYQGKLLACLDDDWCIEERSRLEIYYLEVLKSLIENCLTSEDFSGAVEYARLMIAVDPLNEDANRGMIYALHQLGNRTAVVEHYKGFTNLLRKELNISPSEETCRLYQQIMAGQVEQVSQGSFATLLARSTAQKAHQIGVQEVPLASPISLNLDLFERKIFANRKQEMQSLNRWWSHQGEIVAQVKGCQGSGKTRLMHEFSSILKVQGTLVGWGSCFTFSQRLPYQVISNVIHSLLVSTSKPLREKIPGHIIHNLMPICPNLADVFSVPASTSMDAVNQPQIFNAFSGLLTYLAQFFPILLVVDDLNWVDNSTQQMLEYLVRYLQNNRANEKLPIRILTTVISNVDQPGYVLSMNASLCRDGLLKEHPLKELDQEAIKEWLTCWCGPAEQTNILVNHLYRQTGGNPFLVVETMKAVLSSGDLRLTSKGWEGPALDLGQFPVAGSIRSLIENLMNGLSPIACQVLQAASIVGPSFSLKTLCQAMEVGEDTLLQALDELLRARVIQEPQKEDCSAYDFTFAHQLIQLAIYNQVAQARRAIFRRRLHPQSKTTDPARMLDYSKSLPEQPFSFS